MNPQTTSTPTPDVQIPFSLPSSSDEGHIYPQSTLSIAVKEQLQTKITHHALIIPARLTAQLRKSLSTLLMHRPKLKDIYPLVEPDDVKDGVNPKSERKIVFGSIIDDDNKTDNKIDNTTNDDTTSISIYDHDLVKPLLENNTKNELYTNIRKATHDVIISYEHYTVEQVLSKLLPPSLLKEIPSSFEVVGSIAHLNLRDEYLPFKYIIGRTILDKNKSIKVCVNKIGTIQNEFRTFPMEIIADDRNLNDNGKGNTLLEGDVREDGCRFKLDFEKVYWNSRLQYEHRRIIHLISGKDRPTNLKQRKIHDNDMKINTSSSSSSSSKNEEKIIVADACAGIGPFAVPLTSQYSHVTVYANDLNPVSFKYLNMNSKINKCNSSKLHTYNMDARYFLRKLDDEGIPYQHVLMNLPAIAPEFLNVFRGWKGRVGQSQQKPPWIHVHCFGGKGEGADEEAMARCSKSLGCKLDKEKDEVTVHIVRDISPKKNMLCVSFRLPEGVTHLERIEEFGDVAVNEKNDNNSDDKDDNKNDGQPDAKKARIDTP